MEEGATALENDRDWVAPLMECHWSATQTLRNLHTVLATGEVLPFSLVLAVAYEYPCTLGQQQPDLHERLVYSSIYGIPLIAPAEAQGIRVEHRCDRARRAVTDGGRRIGYVSDNRTDLPSSLLTKPPYGGLRQAPSHVGGRRNQSLWKPWRSPCARLPVGLRTWLQTT